MKHCPVKHHCNNAGDKRRRHFGAAVRGCIGKHPKTAYRFFKMKQALFSAKHSRHAITQTCGGRRSTDSHVQTCNKHIVQHNIQNAARYRTNKRKRCLFTCNHIQCKIVHQQDGHRKQKVSIQICHAILCHIRRQIHTRKNPVYQQIPNAAHKKTNYDIYQNQKGKILPCLLLLFLPHLFHNYGASAGCQHSRNGCHKLNNRRRQVDCRKRICANQIGHKQTIHHRIKGHKNRHGNRWYGKFHDIFQSNRFFIHILFFHMPLHLPRTSGQSRILSPIRAFPSHAACNFSLQAVS